MMRGNRADLSGGRPGAAASYSHQQPSGECKLPAEPLPEAAGQWPSCARPAGTLGTRGISLLMNLTSLQYATTSGYLSVDGPGMHFRHAIWTIVWQASAERLRWLQVQYRMHPTIAAFASNEFYNGRIENGPNVAEETAQPFHKLPGLGPMAFYHVNGTEATPEGSASIVNAAEADMVVALIHCLVQQVRRSKLARLQSSLPQFTVGAA
jgi:AAA domain